MTRKNHPTLIVTLIGETIRALQIGAPISKGLVLILLEPWLPWSPVPAHFAQPMPAARSTGEEQRR
jgi:hypothetical protein